MNDTLKELVLKKEITEHKYYNSFLLLSAVELALLRVRYIEVRVNEEQQKAEEIELSDKNKSDELDLYVHMPYIPSILDNREPDISDSINFSPPRSKWKMDTKKSIDGFISNCIWSLQGWKEVKNWLQKLNTYYKDLCVSLKSQITLFDLMIREFPHKDGYKIDEQNPDNAFTNDRSDLLKEDNVVQAINESTDSLNPAISTKPMLPKRIDFTEPELEDLKTFDENLPSDIIKIVDYISQLVSSDSKNIKKLIVDRVWELYANNYKSNPSFSNKSNFLRIVFQFINRKELHWDIKKFLKYAQNS